MWKISSVYFKILEILFPPRCYTCRKEAEVVCTDCLKRFSRAVDSPAHYIQSTFSFKDKEIKRIIHAVKYYNKKELVIPLARTAALELKNSSNHSLDTDWHLVPIPMPTIRKYMRGYNHAEIIAKEISKITSFPVSTNILVRARSPKRQVTTATRSERLNNQRKSFKVCGDVKDMNIILVDDVSTTGATLDEARRVLLQYGAKNVQAVTLAH